ncbi:MAG: hypothetical protein QNJ73_06530 [Gammaproteobacteria bacterium]|nr:hypothetical protein [Gammaproteobacteria bacterium]
MTRLCIALLLALMLASPAAADWQPDQNEKLQVRAKEAAERFRSEQPKLQRFFDEAYAYAVFPRVTRGGLMFALGRGKGVVIEGNELIGYVTHWQLTLGAQLGAQQHAQIIFFRDAEALEAFKKVTPEFIGQASAALATVGGGLSPGYLPSVAIFNLMKGGLMLEVAAGAARYRYRPVK